jgi:hypothetical protein
MRIERCRAGQILHDVPKRFIDSNFFRRAAAFDLTHQNLANLSDDVCIADQTRRLSSEKLAALLYNALPAVGDEAGANYKIVINFGRAGMA